jgi:DNA-binding response OmpR family regulator
MKVKSKVGRFLESFSGLMYIKSQFFKSECLAWWLRAPPYTTNTVLLLDLLIERKQQRVQHQQLNHATDSRKIDFQHRLAVGNKISTIRFCFFPHSNSILRRYIISKRTKFL